MAVTYDEIVAHASDLNPQERLRLATELLLSDESASKRSALEFLGANGPIHEDVDARLRRSRDE